MTDRKAMIHKWENAPAARRGNGRRPTRSCCYRGDPGAEPVGRTVCLDVAQAQRMRPLEVSPHLVRALDNVHKIITKLSVAGASDGRSKTRTDRDRVRAAGAVVDMMRAAPTWRAGPSSATEWFESDSYSATVTMCPSHGT